MKNKKLTLMEVFQLENPTPVDPAQHGEDIKKQALIKAYKDIAPYVKKDDPTLTALNNLLASAKWEGGLPRADQIKFGEGLFGLGKSDASKKVGDAKRQALATAVKDLKPHVPEDDPTIAALNDLLSKSEWEAGPGGGKPTVDWGKFKEGCIDECGMMGEEEEMDHDVASPLENNDQDILLDLELPIEPSQTEEEEEMEYTFPTSSNMLPMASIVSPEVIVVKVSDRDDNFMDPTISDGPLEIPMPLNSRSGAPGSPRLNQLNDNDDDFKAEFGSVLDQDELGF